MLQLAFNHLADLHILINTIHSPSILNNAATASYLPICLPKFNPSAFVNAYVMFLPKNDTSEPSKDVTSDVDTGSVQAHMEEQSASDATSLSSLPTGLSSNTNRPVDIALVAVSGSADFELVRGWADTTINVRTSVLVYEYLAVKLICRDSTPMAC